MSIQEIKRVFRFRKISVELCITIKSHLIIRLAFRKFRFAGHVKSLGRSKGSGGFFVNRPHRQIFFLAVIPTSIYNRASSSLFRLSHSFPDLAPVASSPVGFSHAKVQRSSGVKHHYANGSRICPAAFRKSKMAFQPPPRTSTGWVFREILRPFACLSVLSPLSGLHVKSLPPRKPKGSESREKKKQVQQIKNLKLCTARFFKLPKHG